MVADTTRANVVMEFNIKAVVLKGGSSAGNDNSGVKVFNIPFFFPTLKHIYVKNVRLTGVGLDQRHGTLASEEQGWWWKNRKFPAANLP